MQSLINLIISERLGPITADFPDASYKNEAAGVLPTPVLAEFMTSYHYTVLRFLQEAGIDINDVTDNITDNQFWDAYDIITKGLILSNDGRSPIAPRIIAGKTRTTSSLPDFIRANGSALSFTLLATATALDLSISGIPVTIAADIVKGSLVAAPSSNNTAAINDINMLNDLYAGEDGTEITIDTVGSEISALVGQIVAFKTPTGEIFKGFLKNATTITNCYRGFYFDDLGDPIVRGNLSNDDIITLMKPGWALMDDDGATVDVTYTTPSEGYVVPSSPSAGDYWYNRITKKWERYSGSAWEPVDRALIGEFVSDATDTIASRSGDLSNKFDNFNNIELGIASTETIESKNLSGKINIYGIENSININGITGDITTDLEGGQSESVSTDYYFYLDSDLQIIFSNIKPYDRKDLKGYYHPYNSWRCVCVFFNDASSDIVLASHIPYNSEKTESVSIIKYDADNTRHLVSTTPSAIPLNTLAGNGDISFIDSNQLGLLPGKHRIKWNAVVFTNTSADASRAFLYNVSKSLIEENGDMAPPATSGSNTYVKSYGEADLVAQKAQLFEIRAQKVASTGGNIYIGQNGLSAPTSTKMFAIVTRIK